MYAWDEALEDLSTHISQLVRLFYLEFADDGKA
jgi:hypothetical protein